MRVYSHELHGLRPGTQARPASRLDGHCAAVALGAAQLVAHTGTLPHHQPGIRIDAAAWRQSHTRPSAPAARRGFHCSDRAGHYDRRQWGDGCAINAPHDL